MELDELKSLINHKLSTDHTGRSAADIASLLTKRTGSVIDKLKRSLWIEIICCVVVIAAFSYLGIAGGYRSLRIYFSVFAVLSFAFLGFIIYLLRRTQKLSATSLPVKGNLQTIVHIIEEFNKRYFQFTMALIPVCFTFAFLLGYNEPEHNPEVDRFAKSLFSAYWQVIVFAVAYVILLSVGIYYFTKWYLRKLYGRYIDQLKECIGELGEE